MDGVSVHFDQERQSRNKFINEELGVGNIIDSFVVDRGHSGGKEIHSVTDTAIILIHNAKTNLLITELVARPAQLKKLYALENRVPPRWLLRIAYKNNINRFNEK